MKFDPKLFELHTEYQKHFHTFWLGHIHLHVDGNEHGQSLLRVCPGCGNIKVFHTSKKVQALFGTDKARDSGWQYAWQLIGTPHQVYLDIAVATQNNAELTAVYDQYVAAVKAGGYRPKDTK
jgi:hypothetical protein